MDPNLTILLLCLGVLAVAGFAIWRLSSTPARIVAVLMALAALLPLKPLAELLAQPQQKPIETVAPSALPGVTAAASPSSPEPAISPSSTAMAASPAASPVTASVSPNTFSGA
ncbi:hypothetical protein [Streptomyces mirabilis]|uniref:hypothetical protein n=1 Tax=Streptomyces mirabilis TaxID=68239 RepID=UPI00369E11B8